MSSTRGEGMAVWIVTSSVERARRGGAGRAAVGGSVLATRAASDPRSARTSRNQLPKLACALLVVFLGAAGVGCSVLTQSEVQAVSNFAEATKEFPTQPAAVMEAHAQLRSERGLLVASTMKNPEPALKMLEQGIKQEARLRDLAAQTTAALAVLDEYTELLTVLSSDRFTDDLQNRSVALGSAIDQSIGVFNKLQGKSAPADTFGDIVAGVVRGGGGVLIRHMQEKALKEAVTRADPAVKRTTKAVEDLMAAYLATPGGLDLFGAEAEDIRAAFPRMWEGPLSHREIATLDRVGNALVQSTQGAELAQTCQAAAVAYRQAHADLVAAMKHEKSLSALREQIAALAAEVRAGKQVRDQLKKASGS
jgi:hypothetical protein